MRELYECDIQKKILGLDFNIFWKTHSKKLCEETEISSGSIYYLVEGRDELIQADM